MSEHHIASPPPFPVDSELEFRFLQDWDGYAASSDGNIWSCRKQFPREHAKYKPYWRQLTTRPVPKRKGFVPYRLVTLTRDKSPKVVLVHQLVIKAFRGPRPSGLQCRHLDGNPNNNSISNLVYGTAKENTDDRKRHGHSTGIRGQSHPMSRFSDSEVVEMRSLYSNGIRQCEILKMFPISQPQLSRILNGQAR